MPRIDRYDYPAELWYDAREHLWLRPARRDDGRWLVTIGLDALGQEALGEVVYVQLAEPGLAVARRQALGSLEAEKMVRSVLAPVAGRLVEVNLAVPSAPRLVNTDPYGAGWLCRLLVDDWEGARAGLLHGDPAVTAWVRAEIEAYERERER
jgi:glycine cleavage system H protein